MDFLPDTRYNSFQPGTKFKLTEEQMKSIRAISWRLSICVSLLLLAAWISTPALAQDRNPVVAKPAVEKPADAKPAPPKEIKMTPEVSGLFDDYIVASELLESRKKDLCAADQRCLAVAGQVEKKRVEIVAWEQKNVPQGYTLNPVTRSYAAPVAPPATAKPEEKPAAPPAKK